MHRLAVATLALTAVIVASLALLPGQASVGSPQAATTFQSTPKPEGSGSLSGVYDILVSPYDPAASEDDAGPNTCSDTIDNGGDLLADVADPDCRDKSVRTPAPG